MSAEVKHRSVQEIAAQIAAPAADDVDRNCRFPTEAIQALRDAGLMGAYVPQRLGGLGYELRELVDVAVTLGQACASTAMIWAMSQIQIACLVHHGASTPFFEDFLGDVARGQLLIASATSEAGIGGDIRTSKAAIEHHVDGCSLDKHASTLSYGEQADAILATARRAGDASSGDQSLVLILATDTRLEREGGWDTLGMRGTCSPPFRLRGKFAPEQILPVPFAEICERTMVPFSHLLWSACWYGIAKDAVRRGRLYVRSRVQQATNGSEGAGIDPRLANARLLLGQMQAMIERMTPRYQAILAVEAGRQAVTVDFSIEINELKVGVSELLVQVVSLVMTICGMNGYRAGGPYSVERHLRDSYSSICMISNDRLRASNAAMALMQRGV